MIRYIKEPLKIIRLLIFGVYLGYDFDWFKGAGPTNKILWLPCLRVTVQKYPIKMSGNRTYFSALEVKPIVDMFGALILIFFSQLCLGDTVCVVILGTHGPSLHFTI